MSDSRRPGDGRPRHTRADRHHFDVIATGGGLAGENVAGRCANGGPSVALVERDLVGGGCSYWGRIPSKTLLAGEDVGAGFAAEGITVTTGVRLTSVRRDGAVTGTLEATGFSSLVFEAMGVLARNGVMVLSSVTGGDRRVEVPSDALNLGFVLGNKVMVGTVNASRADFEPGVRDLAVADAQWLGRLLTHPGHGLDNALKALELLGAPGAIKVFVEVTALP